MYYDDYEESYYDYDYDEANEEALDMAIDMVDRYGLTISDAYQFAIEMVDPDKVYMNYGVRKRYTDHYTPNIERRDRRIANDRKVLDNYKNTYRLRRETYNANPTEQNKKYMQDMERKSYDLARKHGNDMNLRRADVRNRQEMIRKLHESAAKKRG